MKIKDNLIKVLSVFLVVSSFVAVAFGAKALTVQEKLEKGQSLYDAGNYDEAMDSFLDVFVEGNAEQINIANEYVNMIHFKRGGVSTPTRVIYDENLEAQKEAYKQEARDLQNELAQDYDNAVVATKETVNSAKAQAQNELAAKQQELLALQEQEQAILLQKQEEAKLLQEQEQQRLLQEQEQIRLEQEQELARLNQQIEEAKENLKRAQKEAETQIIVAPANIEEQETSEEIIIQEQENYSLTQREQKIEQDISAMQESLIAKLNKLEGVNVYMRKGKVDAIDIDSDVIFHDDKITFSSSGKEVLEDVYALMLLSKEPVFVLLPPGSYTDEVDLQGVRQVVALNSYLINKGISSSKINFNMGLLNEQPPAKFSNLEGISIVFDYDDEPVLYNNITDKEAYPILSLGMYPEKINPALGEGMVIDFSVIETAAPIENWKLQIIQHASDGKYYIVRQVSGEDAVYEQIFWNGKKQFFGAALPAGKYTLMLRAKDNEGREKIVRRKVIIVAQEQKQQSVKEAKQPQTTGVKQAALDYTTPRLWTKPAKILRKQNAVQEETINVSEQISTDSSSSRTETVEVTTTTVTTQSSAQNTQNGVVNPSASPEQDGLAYDPSLEELL